MGDREETPGPDAEKEQLRRENERLKRELEKAREEIQRLRKRLAPLEAQERLRTQLPSAAKPVFWKKHRSGTQGRPGAPEGHEGVTRPLPDRVDREVDVTAVRCPDCHHRLGAPTDVYDRTVEDIVIVPVVVTKFHVNRYLCSTCGRKVSAPVPGALPRSRFGTNLASFVGYLRTQGLSRGKLADLLRLAYDLNVTRATVQGLERAAARSCAPALEAIRAAVRRGRVTQADETSWPVDGDNHWMWVFRTRKAVLFEVDGGRGAEVPLRVLGPRRAGQVLVRDRWRAYEQVEGAQQLCLVHINRQLQKVEVIRRIEPRGFLQEEEPTYKRAGRPPAEFLSFAAGLRAIMREAVEFSQRAGLTRRARARAARNFLRRLAGLLSRGWKDEDAARLGRELMRERKWIFTFVERPGVPWHNNACERDLRGPVLVRKTTNGHRTEEGAEAFATLMSVRETSRLRGENYFDVLKGLMARVGPPRSVG